MELRHLRYFIAAAELEHFGKAAKRLGIVQPALSKQIRELEEEAGVPLFERQPRGVRLSHAGRSLLEDARALLAQAEASLERARSVAHGLSGELHLGFVDTSVYHPIVPSLLQSFRSGCPDLRLELHQAPSVAQWDLLRAEKIDAGLVYHLPPNRPELRHLVLAKEEILLVVPQHHPLAKRRQVRLRELEKESFVFCPRSVSPPFHDKLHAACRRHQFEPRITQEAQTDHTILSLVAAGAGLSFCIDSTRLSKPQSVAFLRITDLELSFDLNLLWSTHNHNPALSRFLEIVRNGSRALPGTPNKKAAPV